MQETLAALLRHPGIAMVGLANVPTGGSALRIREAMLGALLAGGVEVRAASWAIDVLPLIAFANALESGSYAERRTDLKVEAERIVAAYVALSPEGFPVMVANLDSVTAGTRADRFRFTVDTFLEGLPAGPGA